MRDAAGTPSYGRRFNRSSQHRLEILLPVTPLEVAKSAQPSMLPASRRGRDLRSKTSLLSLAGMLCLLPLGLVLPAVAQTAFDAITIEQRADQWIKPYVAAGDFSGVVLIAQGNQMLVEKAYGKADFQHDVANQIATRFRIASLSKTFTAAAIELLAAQGQLSLKDPLSKYVSGIANGDKITVEQLLTHHSGVGKLDAPEVTRDCLSDEELLKRLRDVVPLFPPGTGSQYSSEGYFLLAVILQKASGVSYSQFLQKNIFAPLKMTNSGSTCKDLPPGPNAVGHVPGAKTGSVVPLPFDEATMVGPGSRF
jgi:CubicO group peptidase (beta-lactamase class C family)